MRKDAKKKMKKRVVAKRGRDSEGHSLAPWRARIIIGHATELLVKGQKPEE